MAVSYDFYSSTMYLRATKVFNKSVKEKFWIIQFNEKKNLYFSNYIKSKHLIIWKCKRMHFIQFMRNTMENSSIISSVYPDIAFLREYNTYYEWWCHQNHDMCNLS